MVTHNGAAKGGTRNQITFMLPPELRIELQAEVDERSEGRPWNRMTLAELCREVLAEHAAQRRARKARIVEPKAAPAAKSAASKARARR